MSILKVSTKTLLSKGFSLVEILVVLGLFSSIATLSLGALFNAKSINTRLQENQSILDNINFSMQTITREIRFGSDFNCILSRDQPDSVGVDRNNCSYTDGVPGGVLAFKPSDAVNQDDRVAFFVKNGVLYKEIFFESGATTTYQMTSNEISIRSMLFYVDGAGTLAVDNKQPSIMLFISAVTKPSSTTVPPADLNIEISISTREPDYR